MSKKLAKEFLFLCSECDNVGNTKNILKERNDEDDKKFDSHFYTRDEMLSKSKPMLCTECNTGVYNDVIYVRNKKINEKLKYLKDTDISSLKGHELIDNINGRDVENNTDYITPLDMMLSSLSEFRAITPYDQDENMILTNSSTGYSGYRIKLLIDNKIEEELVKYGYKGHELIKIYPESILTSYINQTSLLKNQELTEEIINGIVNKLALAIIKDIEDRNEVKLYKNKTMKDFNKIKSAKIKVAIRNARKIYGHNLPDYVLEAININPLEWKLIVKRNELEASNESNTKST